ncbi:MAG: hypothetical protein JXA38_07495 [Methanosarcinaceae archaeon]|nr:hypothetical protein [Methanosarcinaceae archaeon]
MTTRKAISIKRPTLKPEEVSPDDAKRVLEFVNTASKPEEIAEIIEFPGEVDVGVKVASNILEKRAEIGTFTNLKQIMDVHNIGPERFTDIVSIVTGKADVVESERSNFKYLIAMNPNYFGNLKISPFESVKVMTNKTTYEELMCVGFNPYFERLEAIIHVKKSTGYGGNICSSGTPEYVRFYVDWDNTGVWEDVGMVSFKAYNIPKVKPLEYDLSIPLDANKKLCFIKNLPKVRAILSWNTPPPADTPNYVPVWGNSVDARIQIDVLKFIVLKDIIKMTDLSMPENILEAVDVDKEISLKDPKKLDVQQLIQLYKDKDIPEHRFGFTQIHKILEKGGLALTEKGAEGVKAKAAVSVTSPLIDLGFDAMKITDIIEKLIPLPLGDTTYEDLKCIGLNTNQDVLAGVIEIKKTCGYSGNLCSAGSVEYVAFWVDWGDGAGWTYVGTASVNVHDIEDIPPEGLQYSVFMPVNLSGRRQPCSNGAKTAKIRAILSWEVAPPTWNSYYIPRWGNRRDTLIHITPGSALEEGDHTPYISVVGNMGIDDIDNSTGLATGNGVMAAFTANESPFGGMVTISGHIAFPPNSFVTSGSGSTPLKYKVFVRQSLPGEPWQQLTNSFNVKLVDQVGSTFYGPYNHKQMIDGNGYYTYMEDLEGNERRFVEGFMLAKWVTSASMSGIWEIRIEAFDPTTSTTYPALNTDGTPQIIKIKIDNIWPVPAIEITGYTRAGITKPAEECGSFRKGDIIHGTYSMEDEHFRYLSLWAEPTVPASGGKLCVQPGIALCTPASNWKTPPSVTRSYPSPVVSTIGESGVWSLDTDGMTPCGYILRLHGSDRTIVDSGYIGHHNGKSVGFCLLKPE